ncbi:NRDE family protein [Kitasatospora sp. RB6PN24]|uniref:NRDE family protein n=1 Tax=Kitasatospora humi TaxID=2893891 RepID=UPI001E32D8D2|nr:NRDE family protein [Kitasatospora humi]MCC9307316.1 NRDE family protein [Kitasatospora humi]
MCTAFVSIDPGSAVPVLLLAVRDEYTDRQWLPPGCHWPSRPAITGGLDLHAGGTWLAVTGCREPVTACLLNGFGPRVPRHRRRSRGEIPLVAASGQRIDRPERYDPFHLILARPGGARVLSWSGNTLQDSELPTGLSIVLNNGLGGQAGASGCPPHIHATMAARTAHFRARLQAVARPEPAFGPPDVAWGQWLPIARGDGLPPDDPAALIRRLEPPGGRVWGTVSLSLVALAPGRVRYDFGTAEHVRPLTHILLKSVPITTDLQTPGVDGDIG